VESIRTTIILLSILSIGVSSHGESGLALMKIEQGARASGMGGAFVSIPSDATSALYNPAGAIDVTEFTATFGHTSYWENIRLESGFFATNLFDRMFAHGGIRFAAVDKLEGRLGPSSGYEEFDAHDISFKGGLSYKLNPKIAVGAAMGWYIEKIDVYRGSAFNFDLGLLAKLKENINVGASVTDVGSDFELTNVGMGSSREISLPTTFRVGGSYKYRHYLGAADIVIRDSEAHLHLGVEATPHEMFKVRGGYMSGYNSKNITAGVAFTKRNLTIDYAFVPYSNELGTTHMFNFTFSL